jgi:hypothetical protein
MEYPTQVPVEQYPLRARMDSTTLQEEGPGNAQAVPQSIDANFLSIPTPHPYGYSSYRPLAATQHTPIPPGLVPCTLLYGYRFTFNHPVPTYKSKVYTMAPRYSRGYHPGYSMVSPLLLVLYDYGPYRVSPSLLPGICYPPYTLIFRVGL